MLETQANASLPDVEHHLQGLGAKACYLLGNRNSTVDGVSHVG